ncbi:MAG TPA: cbb3-type cytochrome c oxidase subunit II [Candidatus Udaeobacter sp.]|jgi:cbb3-type cytochrome oxidase cytochrome c subunit|nr:cbb3-type cytochrome c oxidase subunit II [Candidatus Udaeobacter sp.]
MKGLAPLFLGIFGTFAFSWLGLTVIPNWQIGHLNPESDEEGTDIYPQPQSGMFERGAHVYAANGCVYCHSEQVRADYAANDIERGWGNRRSAPVDYIFERPVFLGKMRMGQDIANIGARAPAQQESPAPAGAASPAAQGASASAAATPAASQASSPTAAAGGSPSTSPAQNSAAASPASNASPPPGQRTGVASPSPGQMVNATPGGSSPVAPTAQTPGAPWPIQTEGLPPLYSAAWHHVHLYAPRSINFDSNMPSYRFLYEKRRITGERAADALQLSGGDAPPSGWEIVPTYDAKCLVAYLMALNQSHPLKGIRSIGAAPSPAASPGTAAQGASPAPAAAASPAAAKK